MFPADAVHLPSNGICFSVATVTLVSSIHNKNAFSDFVSQSRIFQKNAYFYRFEAAQHFWERNLLLWYNTENTFCQLD